MKENVFDCIQELSSSFAHPSWQQTHVQGKVLQRRHMKLAFSRTFVGRVTLQLPREALFADCIPWHYSMWCLSLRRQCMRRGAVSICVCCLHAFDPPLTADLRTPPQKEKHPCSCDDFAKTQSQGTRAMLLVNHAFARVTPAINLSSKTLALLVLTTSSFSPFSSTLPLFGRRTEQAKANLDPRVGPRVAPRVGPRVLPREHPRGLISLFSALQGLPTKHPTKMSTERPTSGRCRGSPVLFSPGLFFDHFWQGTKAPVTKRTVFITSTMNHWKISLARKGCPHVRLGKHRTSPFVDSPLLVSRRLPSRLATMIIMTDQTHKGLKPCSKTQIAISPL